MLFKLSNLNSNLALTLGYLKVIPWFLHGASLTAHNKMASVKTEHVK